MDYIILIPILIVISYGTLTLKEFSIKKKLIFAITIGLLSLILFSVFNRFMILSANLVTLLVINVFSVSFFLQFENRPTIIFILIFVISICLLLYLSYVEEQIAIFVSFLIMLTFLLTANNQSFLRKSYEEAATEYQNKILDKQVEEVRNIYFVMRSWRHDYHNHLQKLKAHMMMNQIKEANEYLNELEIDLDNVNQLVESGNINLDAILNSKLSLAINNNVQISYKAVVPKELTISDIDLCVLIGNLIDNAVEACEKVKGSNPKFTRLYIGIFKKQLYISVSNSTNEVIRKLNEEYITTKRGNHGHGLKRINNIVEKYDGYINRQNEPGVFVTEVLLPL